MENPSDFCMIIDGGDEDVCQEIGGRRLVTTQSTASMLGVKVCSQSGKLKTIKKGHFIRSTPFLFSRLCFKSYSEE